VTTIMVTHDQEEALTMADRIVVMNHGVIEQVGTPQEIYRKPASEFVADFVGTMTFLDAKTAGDDRLRLGTVDLVCPGASRFGEGETVRIGMRPEEIRVRNIDAATPNRITVKVAALDFLGAFCRAELEPEAVPGVTMLADFSVNLMRDLAVVEGQTITVVLPPESLRVYPKL
jgi:iron(III) transport system ATP-binding protein